MAKTDLPSVQDHARTLIDQAIADGRIQADPEANALAAAVPTFSTGTAPLDSLGKPVVEKPPAFDKGQVAIPTGEPTPESAVQAPKPTEGGLGTPPPQAPAAPPAEQQTQAAEAAAEAIADRFADSIELELDEPDYPDMKIPVKVPKQYEAMMKRAFPRRADYDRVKARWGEAAPVLEPLFKDGRIKQIIPLIQRAFADPEFGDLVANVYDRRVRGLPMIEQAIREAAAQAPQAIPSGVDIPDPYVAQMVEPVLNRLGQVEGELNSYKTQREADTQRQAEQARQNAEMANKMQWAHYDLAQQYPDVFDFAKGPNDPNWQRAIQVTRDYGYADTYDLRAAIVFGGQKFQNLEAERLAATASPAARAIEQMDSRQVELARQEAGRAAQLVGGGAPAPSAAPPPPARPTPKTADGKMKSSEQFLSETYQWLVQTGQIQAS